MAEENGENLEELTVAELRSRASELEITGRSSMKKDELVTAVGDAEEQTRTMSADESGEAEAGSGSSSGSDRTEASASDADSDSDAESDDDGDGLADSGKIDASGISAPSIGPNTTIDLKPPEERLDEDKISNVDAMGLDKRRQVQGERYGASPLKQLVVYGVFLIALAGVLFGAKLLTDELDTTPITAEPQAPWAQPEAGDNPPVREDIDFPESTDQ